MPDILVVERLLTVGEQHSRVNDPQVGNGLVVTVHEIQQQKFLPHGHALGRRATNALKVGTDGLGFSAGPGRAGSALPDLRLVNVSGQVLLLRRLLLPLR